MQAYKIILFIVLILIISFKVEAQTTVKDSLKSVSIIPADLLKSSDSSITVSGKPEIVDSPFGKAVRFNGENNAIFLNYDPLKGMNQFTIEVIMKPENDGSREQRFIHIGELKSDRLMMEIRLNKNRTWYYDGFVKSGESKLTLVDTLNIHQTEKWYNATFCVDNGKLTSYINGKKELSGNVDFSGINSGTMSVGVRLNHKYWFKGEIYKIKITPKIIEPTEFIQINP